VIQKLINTLWLLVLCGIFDAMFAVLILTLRTGVSSRNSLQQMGVLALAAGACAIAAGLWNATKLSSWLMILNGLACSALGTMMLLATGRRLGFRTIALLIALMAVGLGVYALARARAMRGRVPAEWLLAGAGVLAVAFAGVFLGFGLRWISLEPSPSGQTFYWLGSYFAFSAMCMLGMGLGQFRPGPGVHPMGNHAVRTA
jgi:uncharacterized membrane protein HdeD (DUF308 family)